MSDHLREWVGKGAEIYHAASVQDHKTQTLICFRRGNQEAVVKVSYPQEGKPTCRVRMPYMGFMNLNDLVCHRILCGEVEHFMAGVNWKIDQMGVALPTNSE